MGYEEYKDLIKRAQKGGKYIIFSLDGEDTSRKGRHAVFIEKSIALMKEMRDIFLEMENGEDILVRDENVIINDFNFPQDIIWPKQWNPFFTAGDFIAFYFHSSKMDEETFKKAFYQASKKVDNDFKYHLAYLKYETNNRVEGSSLLWGGYALQCLNIEKSLRKEILQTKNNKR